MQSSNNAGIIVYRSTKMPSLLSNLALPKQENQIVISGETSELSIYFFDCPVAGNKLDKKRYKLLRDMVDKNKIKFLVECFETKVESNVTPKKNEPHYTQLLEEIKAIKLLASLIKLSEDREENLLTGSIGFILSKADCLLIDYLSEEASSVMLYEGSAFNEKLKTKLHNEFMEKKGVSIVFSKEIESIIMNSSIIVIDEGISLAGYHEALKDKIIVGSNKTHGIKSISNVILWTEALNRESNDHLPYDYNDEILAIMRYFNMELDIIDFIKSLPYIYFDYR